MIEPRDLARPGLLDLPSYKTGVNPSLLKALSEGRPVARLGSNENPFGASPRVYEALREIVDVHLYPDGGNRLLRAALGERLGVDPESLVVSTGSENVLASVFACVLSPGDRVITLGPSFLLTEILAKAAGAVHVPVGYRSDLTFAAEDVESALGDGARILYLSNPNNPTGNTFLPAELSRILAATPPTTLVVVDEAYFEYASAHEGYEGSLAALQSSELPFVVLRTFSKAWGLAGLRVGYGITYHPDLVPLIRRGSTIFDVGTPSQAAALAALTDESHVEGVVVRTLAEKARVSDVLAERSLRRFPSWCNFVTLWYQTHAHAIAVEQSLGERGVFVKALPGNDGEGLLRVSIGRPDDNDRFLAALAECS